MRRLNPTQIRAIRKAAARLVADSIDAIDLTTDDVLSRLETVQSRFDPHFHDHDLEDALSGALDRELQRVRRLYNKEARAK